MAENVNVVQKAAQQRYYNKGTGRMEAPHKGFEGHRPAPAARPQAPQRAQPPREPSLISLTPAQILQRAQKVVGSEVQAERLPFQQRTTELGQQRVGTLQAHAQNYGQFNTSIAGQQTAQQASAKTFLNTAADAVKKAGEAAPGAAETAERLGLKPGEQLPESVRRQQESAKTLLQGITGASQAGTIQRQQSEADFLTNLKAAAEKQNVEGAGRIGSEYNQAGQKNAGEEARLLASQRGRVGRYAQGLEGEQSKLRLAAEASGLKVAGLEQKETQSQRTAATTRRGQNLTAGTATKNREAKAAEGKLNRESHERVAAANRAAKVKATGPDGKPLPPAQAKAVKEGIGSAFTVIGKMREGGVDWGKIRNALTQGYASKHRTVESATGVKTSKPYNERLPQVKNQLLITAGEQLYRYHHVDGNVRKQLEATLKTKLGPDAELYEAMTGQKYTPPGGYTRTTPEALKKV